MLNSSACLTPDRILTLPMSILWRVQVPGDAEAALHRLQTKLLDVPAGAKRASREVLH